MQKFLGWLIILANAAAILLSANYFLFGLQISYVDWFVAYAAPLSFLMFALGFIINNDLLMAISVPFLAAYGTFRLSASSSWSSGIPLEQAGNLSMTIALIYVIYATIKKRSYVEFVTGIAIGMFLLISFNALQMEYLKERPYIMEKMGAQESEKMPLTGSASQEITTKSTTQE